MRGNSTPPKQKICHTLNQKGSIHSKMAAVKPEIASFQLPNWIKMNCQGPKLHFQGPTIEWDYHADSVRPTKPDVVSPIWRPPNRMYLYLRLQMG